MTTRHLEYTLDRLLSRETSIPGPEIVETPSTAIDSKVNQVHHQRSTLPGKWFN